MGNKNSKEKKNKNKNKNNDKNNTQQQQQQQQQTQPPKETTKQPETTNTNNTNTNNTSTEPKKEETSQPTTETTTEQPQQTTNETTTEVTTDTTQPTDQTNETTTEQPQEEKTDVQFTPEVDENGLFKFLDGVVTRREINSMSTEEQTRFMDAVYTMAKNTNGAGTSHFFRIAGYHGQPSPIYCSHGVETFPGWHRIYLKHFEDHLRLADRQNGNDGNIGLPYWDWATHRELPEILRKRWSEFPKDLFPSDLDHPYKDNQVIRASNSRIRRGIESWGIAQEGNDCLLAVQHWVHASTGNEWASPYPSLESPHNSIHGLVGGNGGPMGSVAWAAFDIAFWLHHCNVDRIYEKYIALETDSAQEFEQYQDRQQRDLFEVTFQPFDKLYEKSYGPKDTFDTEAIGFKYDELPPTPKQELRAKPTLVVYPQVKVSEFESKCYQVHTFIVDKTKENEFKPPKNENDFDDNPNYAGTRMIFGRGMECSNCATRPPYDIVIDISKTLRELNISRYNVKVLTYVFETNTTEEVYMVGSETPLPEPVITGSLFEDSESSLQNDDNKENDEVTKNEVMQLQRYLTRYGYYDDEIDGVFGSVTEQAVKDFQKAAGLTVDGIVGPLTKKLILFNKRCSNVDGFASNNVKDNESKGERNYNQEKLTYSLGIIPGYLNRENVLKAIDAAWSEWGQYVNMTFEYVESSEVEVDIKVEFNNVSGQEQNSILRFDGIGGVLGHSGKGYIYFDMAERWDLGFNVENNQPDNTNVSDMNDPNTWYRGQPTVSFYYVTLHEMGHVFGLDHSNDGKDVMGPYYTPELTKLQEGDINRIKALYSNEQQQEEQPQEEQQQEEQQEEQQQEENQENQDEQPQEEQQQEEQPQEEQQQEEQQQEEQQPEENQENQDEQPQEEVQENQDEQPQE